MRLNTNVVVMPEPGNEGEDLSWIPWMVFSHDDPVQLDQEIIYALVDEFFTNVKDKIDDEQWWDSDRCELFMTFMDGKGYNVFNTSHIVWCSR